MMLGRTPPDIEAKRPLRDGVIADFKAAAEFLKWMIKAAHSKKSDPLRDPLREPVQEL